MKRYVHFILALLIAFSSIAAEAQNRCEGVHLDARRVINPQQQQVLLEQLRQNARADLSKLSPQKRAQIEKEALEIASWIHNLRKWTDRIRKTNSSYENTTIYNARRRLNFLKQDLQLGYKTHAIGLYRELFHQVENSYLTLKTNVEALEKMRKNSPKAIALQKENKKLFKILGENFEEYLSVRTYLEAMSLQDPSVGIVPDVAGGAKVLDQRIISREILAELGIPAEHKSVPNLPKPKERVSIESLIEFYEQNPAATVAKIKQDIRDDILTFGKSLIFNNPALSFIQTAAARLPQSARVFVTKVLDVLLERHLVHRYMSHIDDVINADESPQIQLDLLRAKNDTSDNKDEMLVTFARLTMYTPKWVELKKHADQVAQESGSQLYVDFAKRMNDAETLAVRLGTFFPGHADIKAVLVRSGVASATGYLLIHYQVQILNWMERALGLGAEAMGFAYEATRAMVSFN